MLFSLLSAVTNLGDTAFLTACVVVILAGLLLAGSRREAAVYALAFLAAGGVIGFLKLTFNGCHVLVPGLPDLRSPSGHAAMTAAAFGIAALIVCRRLEGLPRGLVAAAAATLILAIAVSRVVLGFHTVAEILAGLAVGGAMIAFAASGLSGSAKPRLSHGLPAAVAVAAAVAYGSRLSAEGLIREVALLLNRSFGICG